MSSKREEELELIRRAATEPGAFGELYESHVRRIYNYIYYRTGNHHDAEDLTARVFQRALNHIANFQDQGVPLSAWLYRIAHNLVANWHRDRSRRPVVPLEDHIIIRGTESNPEIETIVEEERQLLLTLVQRLPPKRQQLLILKFVERLSNAEIGVIMDRTEGAIKSLYHRTLGALREDLQRMEEQAAQNRPKS
ncbi:MAG: sigma-70 family RNA polymerase sigma factor [Anaerolineales bacterium]|nr:sigma-70 family RNA polymerase sigma factor [Anaerolineales bacterium]